MIPLLWAIFWKFFEKGPDNLLSIGKIFMFKLVVTTL